MGTWVSCRCCWCCVGESDGAGAELSGVTMSVEGVRFTVRVSVSGNRIAHSTKSGLVRSAVGYLERGARYIFGVISTWLYRMVGSKVCMRAQKARLLCHREGS